MSFKQAGRPEDGRPVSVHWAYQRTLEGTKWIGYSAGPASWYECHEINKKTKPCADALTSHEVSCRFCAGGSVPLVRGFVPLFRADTGTPVFVIVPENGRELIEDIPHHARVLIERKAGIGEPVSVIRTPSPEPRFHTRVEWKMRYADITASLVKIWGVEELAIWYAQVNRCEVPKAKKKASAEPPVKSDGKPFSPMLEAAARRYDNDSGDPFADVVNRITQKHAKLPPHDNGKPKPKG
jgi:hypothetical protein